ncbi:peptidylprolyl isomerase [Paraflavitalea sp. CAU 1676]|uniref:foldase protein PrsA n=1 Tax=Paraflavitalea sp. CAU 1676 TaxID=3032598 RepID=UPI0023DAF57B|nr:peptidylprolyl isomerase [Paraflavitalea sp. CAU 1676]MDF2186897.1 peptidylprolyl isomerase [Paraflavitalea sp. CAU 1676]
MKSFLRTIVAASLCVTSLSTIQAQTIFTYGNKSVSKDEFLKAFNKNNAEAAVSDQAYRDYLDLYTRFKIKVQAALDARLDTLSTQQNELAAFRGQVVESYMNDEASVNILRDEAIQRAGKDIHVAHIFIAAGANATAEQAKQAQQKIQAAYARLQAGDDFTKTALAYSEDPAVHTNKGDLGYITVFVLPYEMETLVYNTPTGKFTTPYRSKNGYHLFKVLNDRKALGRMKAAQILLSFVPEATDAQQQEVARKADSLYNALLKGGDFKQLAAAFSNDNLTYQTGGEMMAFGVGRYTPAFEQAAFALEKDGDISKPILTEYGYHIIKRLQRVPIPADKAEKQYLDDVKQQVLQSDRMEVARKVLNKKILQQTGYRKLPFNEKSLSQLTTNILGGKKAPLPAGLTPTTPLFVIGKKTFRVKEWQQYLETIRGIEAYTAGKTNAQLLDQFAETSAADYYRAHLETYNKDFAYQLNEFKEGNLLFEIMQRNVWDKAAADSNGLKKYYDAHKGNYWWDASAEAIILTTVNEASATEARKKLEADYRSWKKMVDGSEGSIQADSGRFELGQIPVLERTNWQPGLITAPVKNETDNSLTFAYIIKLFMDRQPRDFADARGFVINDYQAALEEKWITELKKKYPLKVNEAVVKSLPH